MRPPVELSPLTARHADRFFRLEHLLRNNAANETGMKFDLNAWGHLPDDFGEKVVRRFGDPRMITEKPNLDCGTVGCAIGLAVLSGEFDKDGLSYRAERNKWYQEGQYIPVPRFEGWNGWSAVELFFGISHDEAFELFQPTNYACTTGAKAELAVAERIREFVERRGVLSE